MFLTSSEAAHCATPVHVYADEWWRTTTVRQLFGEKMRPDSLRIVSVRWMPAWMHASRLRLNPELISLDSNQQLEKLNITNIRVLSFTLRLESTVRNLVAIVDSQLTSSSHNYQRMSIWTCVALYSQWHQTRPRRCHMLSLPADWITAIHCCVELLNNNLSDYSRYRMPLLLVW